MEAIVRHSKIDEPMSQLSHFRPDFAWFGDVSCSPGSGGYTNTLNLRRWVPKSAPKS
jgi:hypothetical protein